MTKRILVVEDQEDNMQILRDLLVSADYEMMEAVNGEEALAAVAKRRPDLGRIPARPRLHFFTHLPHQGRTGDEAAMTKILVVEDQEDNRQILRDLLASVDYEMVEAENGQEALTAVTEHKPDLILMDIQLPVMDGYEATRRIKADPATKSIPIIVVTSYALSGDEGKAREAGCDAYVTKPYSPRQLLAKIREYLPK